MHRAVLVLKHPDRQTPLELCRPAWQDRVQQVEIDPRRHRRDRFEQPPLGCRQLARTCEYGVADGLGNAGRPAAEHLADEERIAARLRVEVVLVGAVDRREAPDRAARKRRERDARDRGLGRELADHLLERMVDADLVVPVGADHERGHPADAPGEQGEHVERRLVGPVQILEHEHGRGVAAELAEQRGKDVRRCGVARKPGGEGAAGLVGDIHQGPEGPRGEEAVAGAPEHPRRCLPCAEDARQRGLADAGLAGDERQSSRPRLRRREQRGQLRKGLVALEQPALSERVLIGVFFHHGGHVSRGLRAAGPVGLDDARETPNVGDARSKDPG
jgi:hypothetical protein